jgi:hypothetical protein
MRYVDTQTGEIIELVPYPPKRIQTARMAHRRPVRAQPMRYAHKVSKTRLARSRWTYKLIAHLGPLVVLAIVALVALNHASLAASFLGK